MKKLIALLAVGSLFFGCAKADPNAAATVGKESITKAELKEKVDGIIPMIKARKPNFSSQDSLQLVKDILDMEVLAKTIMMEAKTDAELAITDSVADADFALKKRQYFADNDSIMNARISANNQTVEEFKSELRKGLVIEKFFKRAASKITVDSLEIMAVVDSNKEAYVKYPTSHILIMPAKADSTITKEKADADALAKITLIADSLKSGKATFEQLAKNNSQCPSGRNGGNLGAGSVSSWDKAFGDAVLKLKTNEVSAPVKSQFGYHLIKLNGEKVMGPDARDRMMITNNIKKEKMDKVVEDLKAKYSVTINIEDLKK